MKAVSARITKALPLGAIIPTCDNSGAKVVRLVGVKGQKTTKRRIASGGVGDLVVVSVIKGKTDIRKQVVPAIIVRQKRSYRRKDGTRIKFEDNAVVVLKDEKGNPKGTIFKGAIAKEATEKWPGLAKVANIVV
ncbi:MAG: 50S ribosomal protein L14 [Nanoarchaeota archaeon]|nr:50S ribosomal protein L14 [Nanoarchaeota archaeon]